MARFADLHLNIQQKVFAHLYYDLEEKEAFHRVKQLLAIATVCRGWRALTLHYAYHTAYIVCHSKQPDGKQPDGKQPECEWKSNIDLIISQRYSNAIRHMKVECDFGTHTCQDLIRALNNLGFSSVYWTKLNNLEIVGSRRAKASSDGIPDGSSDEVIASQLAGYFGQHVPNVLHLGISLDSGPSISQLLSSKLTSMYLGQLSSLDCQKSPILFDRKYFSSRLTRLQVMMGSKVAHAFPRVLAEKLQVLSLRNIPLIFSWSSFISDYSDHTIFTNLRKLSLQFGQPAKDTSPAMLDTNGRQLHFPMLRSLKVYDNPYSDNALYSLFARSHQLQSAEIGGSLKSVQTVDTHILSSISEFRCVIDDVTPDNYNDFIQFTHKIFGCTSTARSAEVWVHGSELPMPFPEHISWGSLQQLTIRAPVSLDSVVQTTAQLPQLRRLSVESITDNGGKDGPEFRAVLGTAPAHASPAKIALRVLSIGGSSNEAIATSLQAICHLVLLTPLLERLEVTEEHTVGMCDFVASYASRFPHLSSVSVERHRW